MNSVTAGVEIPKHEWSRYLDSVSREMEDAQLSLEFSGDRWASAMGVSSLALQFVAYLGRDELFEIAGHIDASRAPGVYHHLVDHPRRIAVDVATTTPSRIEVESSEGQRTVITLDRPDGD